MYRVAHTDDESRESFARTGGGAGEYQGLGLFTHTSKIYYGGPHPVMTIGLCSSVNNVSLDTQNCKLVNMEAFRINNIITIKMRDFRESSNMLAR